MSKTACYDCCIPSKECASPRRCFINGEFCSKQKSIQAQKKKLHSPHTPIHATLGNYDHNESETGEIREINAFVIMNFSNMSDVVYKWRIRPFVESLTKYLYLDNNDGIHCISDGKLSEKKPEITNGEWHPVNKINVIRADTNPETNFVMCNRICQQIQIADLVIVDVSMKNVNVFYEFGMAVAQEKLILPICYNESFFKLSPPRKMLSKDGISEEQTGQEIQSAIEDWPYGHHIDGFPWRRKLFEFYGIRYRSKKDCDKLKNLDERQKEENITDDYFDSFASDKQITNYQSFTDVTVLNKGFSDIKYTRFPYCDKIHPSEKTVGEIVYERLRKSYNSARYMDNTLIVYTMDGFLNEEQAGICIINYYTNITSWFHKERCFCGDRVGVLLQSNTIAEKNKDAKRPEFVEYSVGDIIHIGTNQATYLAHQRRIKPEEFFEEFTEKTKKTDDIDSTDENTKKLRKRRDKIFQEDTRRFMKNYIRNRAMPIYPDDPIYVSRIKGGLQRDVLSVPSELNKFFCMYHVMLRTLKYTDELIVDVSRNSLQSLFWLGVAHAAGVSTIVVKHSATDADATDADATDADATDADATDADQINTINQHPAKSRDIFDISGLWTAVLESQKVENFYSQLYQAQLGIEQNSRLMLRNLPELEKEILEQLYSHERDSFETVKRINEIINERVNEEKEVLESYYRRKFWKSMLVNKNFTTFLPEYCECDSQEREKKYTVQRDVDTNTAFLRYISSRRLVGDNTCSAIPKGENIPQSSNFISIGVENWPTDKLNCTLSDSKQFAQLTMRCEANEHFCVSLIGTTGSSITALASLFATKEKLEPFDVFAEDSGDMPDRFLVEIQHSARHDFIQKYGELLKQKIEEIDINFTDSSFDEDKLTIAKEEYIYRVIYAVQMYLTTTLYRYFFPALKRDDIKQICNGLKTCIYSMMVAKISPFSLSYESKTEGHPSCASEKYIRSTIDVALKVLREMLTSFCGIDAIFQVEVIGNDYSAPTDKRKIQRWEFIKDSDDIKHINCIYDPPLQFKDQEKNNQNQEGKS